MAQVPPPIPTPLGLCPVTSSTASARALKPSDSVDEGLPDGWFSISSTRMDAPVCSAQDAAIALASAATSPRSYMGRILMSMQNSSCPGIVLTFSTVAGLMVGSKVDELPTNVSSVPPNFSGRDSMRSVSRRVDTR